MSSLVERLRAAPVTVAIFAACIVVFALARGQRDIATLIEFGAVSRGLVWSGEWWRLFTSMFLHIGLTHLAMNLWFGFSWAAPLEKLLGPARFLLVYVLSGLAGSALSVIGHDAVSAGASGALFGLMGATLVVYRVKIGSWGELWANRGLRETIIMALVWLVAGPFLNFDSFAHAGGLLAGAAIMWGMAAKQRAKLVFAIAGIAMVIAGSLRPLPAINAPFPETTKRSAE